MVDKPRRIAADRCVNDFVIADAEHVAADALRLIALLAPVGQRAPDHLAGVLDDHLAGVKVTPAVETAAMDTRPVNADSLSGERAQPPEAHRHRQVETG